MENSIRTIYLNTLFYRILYRKHFKRQLFKILIRFVDILSCIFYFLHSNTFIFNNFFQFLFNFIYVNLKDLYKKKIKYYEAD